MHNIDNIKDYIAGIQRHHVFSVYMYTAFSRIKKEAEKGMEIVKNNEREKWTTIKAEDMGPVIFDEATDVMINQGDTEK